MYMMKFLFSFSDTYLLATSSRALYIFQPEQFKLILWLPTEGK